MEICAINEILPSVLRGLKTHQLSEYAKITSVWGSLVGDEQADHSEPYALHGKILFVRVDDSTLAFELSRKYKMSLIRRIEHVLGEGRLIDIAFRVGGLSRSCAPHTI